MTRPVMHRGSVAHLVGIIEFVRTTGVSKIELPKAVAVPGLSSPPGFGASRF